MLALYRCGRQAEALDSYRATRSRLVEQLGLEPGAALRTLEQAILRHDDALDRPVAPPAQPADTPIAHTIVVAPLELTATGALLEDTPCDVAVLVDGKARTGPVFVPFTGAEHDWAAVELGAWQARARSSRLVLVGSAQSALGRDASRLLASASLALQRAAGVAPEPELVDPGEDALLAAAAGAAAIVAGLSERWTREGIGAVRLALARRAPCPVLLVRSGLRPGGLAPAHAMTSFTWSSAR